MASNQEYSQWDQLKEIVIEWLKNHPLGGIDDIFAHYLDPTDTIYRSYQVRVNSAIQVFDKSNISKIYYFYFQNDT